MNAIWFFLMFQCFFGPSEGLKLKLYNGGQETFKKVSIEIEDKKFDFFDLRSKATTNPIALRGSYHYFKTTIMTSTDTISSYPLSYEGQRYYEKGTLTINLKIETINNKKVICFKAIQ